MSSAAMNWAFETIVPNLKDQVEKLVLLRLADRADPSGLCWPGHSRTAMDLNISTRSVQAAVKNLQLIGLLKVEERRGTSGLIKLKLDSVIPANIAMAVRKKPKKLLKLKIRGEAISPPDQFSRGEAISPRGCNHFTPGGEAISPEPETESEIKQPPPQVQNSVVVVDTVDTSQIHWPAGLELEKVAACAAALASISVERAQELVDEMAGAMAQRAIRNPPGWLRSMVSRDVNRGVVLELAADVARVRQARAAAKCREDQCLITTPLLQPSGRSIELSPGQLAGRQAALMQLAAIKRKAPLSA